MIHPLPTHNVLEDTSKGEDETRADRDEEDGGDVERKRDTGVRHEDEDADAVQVVQGLKALDERHDNEVDDGADGRVVVERHNGVHLEAVEQDLDHDQARRLEDDGSALADEAEHLKVELAVGSCLSAHVRSDAKGQVSPGDVFGTASGPRRAPNAFQFRSCRRRFQFWPRRHSKVPFQASPVLTERATDRDHHDNGEEAAVGLLELEGEGDQEDRNGVERLEHLDERDAEGEVGVVGEDERAREERADGEDGLHPPVAAHLNVLGAIDKGGGALQHTRRDGREKQVPGGEEDGVGEMEVGEDVFCG